MEGITLKDVPMRWGGKGVIKKDVVGRVDYGGGSRTMDRGRDRGAENLGLTQLVTVPRHVHLPDPVVAP